MSTASITSSVTAPTPKATVVGASRQDLAINDVVALNSTNAGTAYAWSIAYKPTGSAATFSGSSVARSPGTFTVDVPGPYLIRLSFTDGTGTTEQFVRLRALTVVGSLRLVAAGERTDPPIPVDVGDAGWADELNYNFNALLALVSRIGSSGRVTFVDPVQGDYQGIQAALDAAAGETPTADEPWFVIIRPGVYSEELSFPNYVHVLGGASRDEVVIENDASAQQLFDISGSTTCTNLTFSQPTSTTNVGVRVEGGGVCTFNNCSFGVSGGNSNQGAALRVVEGTVNLRDCSLEGSSTAGTGTYAIRVNAAATVSMERCTVGVRGVHTNGETSLGWSSVSSQGTYATLIEEGSFISTHSKFTGDVAFNPAGTGTSGDLIGDLSWTDVDGALSYDETNVSGTTTFRIGSLKYVSLSLTGSSTSTIQATTLFYDNSDSGLAAEDVQAALDEVSEDVTDLKVRFRVEQFDASSFSSAGGGEWEVNLAAIPKTGTNWDMFAECYRNGVADMENVGSFVAAASSSEFRVMVTGGFGKLRIGSNITSSGNVYKIRYMSAQS